MVTAVIPTWNRRDLLETILLDLRAQTAPPERIIVIENGSSDDSHAVGIASGAEVISWPENRGFAPAVNAGVRAASSEWVLIVNNDVRLPPDWLATMRAAADRHPEAAFIVPKLMQAGDPGQVDGTFDALSRSGFAWRCGSGRRDAPAWCTPGAVQFAPLTAVLVRRAVFEEVGFLEEAFESYYEDVEFFLRCALKDIRGWYEPVAIATHLGSATLGKWNKDTVFRISRNQRWLTRIYFHELPRKPVVAGQLLWCLLCLRHGCAWAFLRGWFAGSRGLRRFPYPGDVARITAEGDAMIRRLQEETGFDWFWKAYFRLVA